MTTAQAGIPIHSPHVKLLDMSKLKTFHISEAPEDRYQAFVKSQQRFLELKHSQYPDTANDPRYQPYATVQVGGKTVARIDNNGFTETSNALGGKIGKLLGELPAGLSGPQLAQRRAEKIAEALGGQVAISSTALSQAQFDAAPKLGPVVDHQAMREDPAYAQLQKTIQARTQFLAQQMGQEPAEAEAAPATGGSPSAAVQKFLDYMSKTPEERYYEALLAEEGLTVEQLEALPPEARAAVEARIQEKMRDKTAEQIVENLEQQ